MLIRSLIVAVLLLLSFFGSTSLADEALGAFSVVDNIPDVIILNGEIGVSTPLDMRRALSLRPQASTVVLASPGGLVASALIMADDIQRLGLNTFIPEGLGCYSACSFLFFAGKARVAKGELGVHQMSSDVPDPSGVQYSTADILDALGRFDVPAAVISRMLRTPSESMYVFSASEVETLGINRVDAAAASDNPVALPRPAVPTASPEPQGTEAEVLKLALFQGLDFFGGDLQSSRMPDAVQCALACRGDTQCRAFTFNANPTLKSGPNCFLKSSTDQPEAYRDAISGLFLTDGAAPTFDVGAIDPTNDVLAGIDYPGGDLQDTPAYGANNPGKCRQACIGNTECRGFSYAKKQKQCWLKGSIGQSRRSPNVISGVKRYVSFSAEKLIPLN